LGVKLCHWLVVIALTCSWLKLLIWRVPKPGSCVVVRSLTVLLGQAATWLGLNVLICVADRLCRCSSVRACHWVLSKACN